MNTKIRLLSQTIIKTINESDVPLEAKRLIVVEILQQLNEESNKAINSEIAQMKQQENQEKEESQDGIPENVQSD